MPDPTVPSFTPGEILTAAELNQGFAAVSPTAGPALTPTPTWDAVPSVVQAGSAAPNAALQALADRTESLNPDNQSAPASLDGTETWAIRKAGAWARTSLAAAAAFVLQTFTFKAAGGVAATARTALARLTDFRVNAAEFGAVPGQDIGPAIQAAHDAGYTIIEVSAGQYPWLTAVTITNAVQIIGAGYMESPNPVNDGTWFENRQTGFTPLTFSGASARGSAIRRCAFWESNHPASTPGWTPAANDFLIKCVNTLGGVEIDDVYMVRVNKGVSYVNCGHMRIKSLRGQIYTTPLYIDQAYDIPAIDYMHIWTFFTSDNNIMAYQQANLDGVWLQRCDGALIDRIFVFGARSTLKLDNSTSGIPTKIYVNEFCTDFCKYGLWVAPGTSNATWLISQMTTEGEAWPSTGVGIPNGAAVQIDGTNCTGTIERLHTQRYHDSVVNITGIGNRLDIVSPWFDMSNQGGSAAPLYNIAAGSRVYVSGYSNYTNTNGAPVVNAGGNLVMSAVANVGNGATDEPRLFWGAGNASVQAITPNANSDLYLIASGTTASVRLRANGQDVLRVDNPGAGDSDVLVRRNTGNVVMLIESSAASSDFDLAAKGSNGSVRLQANGHDVLRVDNPSSGDSDVLVRSGTGSISLTVESASSSADINLNPKGTGRTISNGAILIVGYAFASLPTPGGNYTNATVRVTDRNNRWATSDGTNWRFMDGTIVS